jgi:septal ring factor EnvC (AmiA/AmiB activator)
VAFEVDRISAGFHAGLGGIGDLVANALVSRGNQIAFDQVDLARVKARCESAAFNARATVLARTVSDLRHQIEEVREDLTDAQTEASAMRAQIASLMADRKILAEALLAAREVRLSPSG